MKIFKTLLFVLFLTGVQQMNAQSILAKWIDLSNFSQVLTKVNAVADTGKFEYLTQVSPILSEYTNKLDLKSVPGNLGTPKVAEMIMKLKNESKAFNDSVLQNASKQDIQNALTEINLTYKELLTLCSID